MKLLLVVSVFLVIAFSTSAQEEQLVSEEQSISEEQSSASEATYDNDPVIYPEEVIYPSSDWDDELPWGGYPPLSYEDKDSVECHGRKSCEQMLRDA